MTYAFLDIAIPIVGGLAHSAVNKPRLFIADDTQDILFQDWAKAGVEWLMHKNYDECHKFNLKRRKNVQNSNECMKAE